MNVSATACHWDEIELIVASLPTAMHGARSTQETDAGWLFESAVEAIDHRAPSQASTSAR